MSADDPRRLILRVCQMYYREDLSHDRDRETARSQPLPGRPAAAAGARGRLRRHQDPRADRLALRSRARARGVATGSRWRSSSTRRQGVAEIRRRVADAAGRLLVEIATDDMTLGISLGKTMQDLVDQLPDRIPR